MPHATGDSSQQPATENRCHQPRLFILRSNDIRGTLLGWPDRISGIHKFLEAANMFTKKIHNSDNKKALRCATTILVFVLLGLSPSRVVLAQQPGGRETSGGAVRPKVRAHRSAKRPVTRKPALNVISLL